MAVHIFYKLFSIYYPSGVLPALGSWLSKWFRNIKKKFTLVGQTNICSPSKVIAILDGPSTYEVDRKSRRDSSMIWNIKWMYKSSHFNNSRMTLNFMTQLPICGVFLPSIIIYGNKRLTAKIQKPTKWIETCQLHRTNMTFQPRWAKHCCFLRV